MNLLGTENSAPVHRDLARSEENTPQTHHTTRQKSTETGLSRRTVIRIIRINLILKCLNESHVQELTAANRDTRFFFVAEIEIFPSQGSVGSHY